MVYVDALINYGWKIRGRVYPSCHLLADSIEELHEFALSIGLKKTWFQMGAGGSVPHYDLISSKRALAVQKGAIEIDRKQLCERMKKYKESTKTML